MLVFALAVAQATASPAATAAPSAGDEAIIVLGRRLPGETAATLAECLARGCPPKEDIAASIAHAQAQFVAGEYLGSRRTLAAARGRNARYAAALPVEVSGLHQASMRMADLNGLQQEARTRMFDVIDALRAGLRNDDERVLLARLDVGRTFAKDGRARAAFDTYRQVEKAARKVGSVPLVGLAIFHRSLLAATITIIGGGGPGAAERSMRAMAGSTEPAWAPFRNALRMVPVMLAAPRDREAALARAIDALEPQLADPPLLLYAPRLDLAGLPRLKGEGTEWIDMRYRVGGDGRVRDVELVRASSGVAQAWVEAVATAMRARRYAPLALQGDEAGRERTERVSFVADFFMDWNSKSAQRRSTPRADVHDLDRKTIDQR